MKLFRLTPLVVASLLSSAAVVVAQECQPSKWGADDELGAADYVNPQRVMDALKLARKARPIRSASSSTPTCRHSRRAR